MTALDAPAIEQIIPHRPPVRLIDRITSVRPGERLTAVKYVTGDDAARGWLGDVLEADGDVYPTSLVLESWAQAAVALVCWGRPNPDVLDGRVQLAIGAFHVELLEPVRPGDALESHVELIKNIGDASTLSGTCRVGGRTVARVGEFMLAASSARTVLAGRSGKES